MASVTRRRFLHASILASGSGLAGCSDGSTNTEASETEAQTETDTETPAGATPPYSPLVLDVINATQETLTVEVEMTERSGTASTTDQLYAETTELEPGGEIDLRSHRVNADLALSVTVESNVLFEDNVEPHEGHSIRIVSDSEVEVDSVVE